MLTFVIEQKFFEHISPKKKIKLTYSIYVTENTIYGTNCRQAFALAFVLNILQGEGTIPKIRLFISNPK